MKTNRFHKTMAVLAIAASAGVGCIAQAAPPEGSAASAPHLSFGVPQVVKLAQGKVGDDTIVAYVKNSGNSYNLDADQILWLRQQGVSDAVLTAMLSQPRAGVAPRQQPPMPQRLVAPNYPPAYPPTSAQYPPPDQYPPVDTSDYAQPYDYPQPYYYPSYYYPPVVYYYGGFGYRGFGYRGGVWHGGGGYGGRRVGGPVVYRGGGPVGHGGATVGGHSGGRRR